MIMTDILITYGPHQSILFSAVLADVLDALGHRTSTLPVDIRPLKAEWKIFGRAATLSAIPVQSEPENTYIVELACIDSLEPGDILVATTNGDRSSALWVGLLSTFVQADGEVSVAV